MAGEVAGFWSYVRADNVADSGRILSLVGRLRDEYRLQTSDDIQIFVDRESLEWGTEWRLRINEAIAGTTFFIPVITPSYFRSQSCRDELLKFAREAKRLGLEQLLMPVYWVSVPELTSDAEKYTDEAIALVARFQWADFREVRLEDEGSSAFRKAVARLAAELAARASQIAIYDVASALSGPFDGDAVQNDESGPGFLDLMAIGEEAMPNLVSIVDQSGQAIKQIGEIVEVATKKFTSAVESGSSAKLMLQLTEALAQNMSAPAENIEQLGHKYVTALAALDPVIHAVIDAVERNVERSPEKLAERDEFLASVQSLAGQVDMALTSVGGFIESLQYPARFSRSLRLPIRRIEKGLKGMLDGREMTPWILDSYAVCFAWRSRHAVGVR